MFPVVQSCILRGRGCRASHGLSSWPIADHCHRADRRHEVTGGAVLARENPIKIPGATKHALGRASDTVEGMPRVAPTPSADRPRLATSPPRFPREIGLTHHVARGLAKFGQPLVGQFHIGRVGHQRWQRQPRGPLQAAAAQCGPPRRLWNGAVLPATEHDLPYAELRKCPGMDGGMVSTSTVR